MPCRRSRSIICCRRSAVVVSIWLVASRSSTTACRWWRPRTIVSMCCTTEFAFAQNRGPSGRSTVTPRYVRRDGSLATDPQAAFSPVDPAHLVDLDLHRPVDQPEQRLPDGDEQAVERAEHAARRRTRRRRRGSRCGAPRHTGGRTETLTSPHTAWMTMAAARCAAGRQQPGGEQDEAEHDDRGRDPAHLGVGAGPGVGGGLRQRAADPHPAEEAGGEVGGAVRDELLVVGLGSTAPLGAKVRTAASPSAMPTAAMARPPVMMPLHRETSTIGMDGIGMPVGTSPTTLHALGGQVEPGRHHDAADEHDERPRRAGDQARATEEHGERGEADDEGQAVEVAGVAHQHGDPLEDAAGGGGRARPGRGSRRRR